VPSTTQLTIEAAVSQFGERAKSKLSNVSAKGTPEDQLRAPFEDLMAGVAALSGKHVSLVGEVSQTEMRTRPDYAVTSTSVLIGFVELKAPGKGAILGSLKTRMTRSNGNASVCYPIFCTPMATHSVSGRMANL
jgi:hypothetical protein